MASAVPVIFFLFFQTGANALVAQPSLMGEEPTIAQQGQTPDIVLQGQESVAALQGSDIEPAVQGVFPTINLLGGV